MLMDVNQGYSIWWFSKEFGLKMSQGIFFLLRTPYPIFELSSQQENGNSWKSPPRLKPEELQEGNVSDDVRTLI